MTSHESLERVRQVALTYLGRRERTVAEMRQRLERAGADEAAVEQVVGELREQSLLDDQRYATLFVQDKRNLEGWGRERIGRTLAERGIERELIAAGARRTRRRTRERARPGAGAAAAAVSRAAAGSA